jgi:hypothetical protein
MAGVVEKALRAADVTTVIAKTRASASQAAEEPAPSEDAVVLTWALLGEREQRMMLEALYKTLSKQVPGSLVQPGEPRKAHPALKRSTHTTTPRAAQRTLG